MKNEYRDITPEACNEEYMRGHSSNMSFHSNLISCGRFFSVERVVGVLDDQRYAEFREEILEKKRVIEIKEQEPVEMGSAPPWGLKELKKFIRYFDEHPNRE